SVVLARTTPEAPRAMAHLRTLAGDIGRRPSTTDSEQKAADYIRKQLEAAGYKATVEKFDVHETLGGQAAVGGAGGRALEAVPMAGAPEGNGVGTLVEAKLGRAGDYAGVTAKDAVVLVTRGESSFADKARLAQTNGAVALVVLNSDTGAFRGDLGSA